MMISLLDGVCVCGVVYGLGAFDIVIQGRSPLALTWHNAGWLFTLSFLAAVILAPVLLWGLTKAVHSRRASAAVTGAMGVGYGVAVMITVVLCLALYVTKGKISAVPLTGDILGDLMRQAAVYFAPTLLLGGAAGGILNGFFVRRLLRQGS